MATTLPAALHAAALEVLRQVSESACPAGVERAVRECYPHTRDLAPEGRAELLALLSPALESRHAEHAVTVGYLCGAMVEDGCPSGAIEAALIQCYLGLAERARRLFDASRAHVAAVGGEFTEQDLDEALGWAAEQLPDEHAAYRLLARAPQPAITVLSASASARRLARPLAALLAPLADELTAARDLVRLALVLDDEPYLALEPATHRGLRGRMSGISDNGQLQVLLMDVFARAHGEPSSASEAALRNARGEGPQDVDEVVEPSFALYDWRAARPGGLSTGDEHVLWNEAAPADIPLLDGERVLLLGAARHRRSWLAQRQFDMLRAELDVEAVLERAEVDTLFGLMASRSGRGAR
jgi:hypothetical protein